MDINTVVQQPVRQIYGKVEFASTNPAEKVLTYEDSLVDFTIERTGENKFFGFGVMTKANVHFFVEPELLEEHNQNNNFMRVALMAGTEAYFPWLHITDRRQDETTRVYSYTAYDNLEYANNTDVSDIAFPSDMISCQDLVNLMLPKINVKEVKFINLAETEPTFLYKCNYEGTETVREVLDEMAEVLQAVYYIDNDNNLIYRGFNINDEVNYHITKDNSLAITSHENRRLQTIAKVSQLGDNVSASTTQIGSTQFIRDNALLEGLETTAEVLDRAIAKMGDITYADCEIDWRGNPCVNIGDKIQISFKDKEIYTYLLNDTLTYNGGLTQKTKWTFDKDEDTASNPTSLGDKLNDTFAVVDKANKRIDMAVKDIDDTKEEISSLQLNQDSINASVSQLEKDVEGGFENVDDRLADILSKVEASMTPEQVAILIKKIISSEGIDSVTTSTGFTFNDKGLTVDKSNSEMSTTITEDGMTIKRNDTNVLIANNQGVEAYNLHAKTYLTIGNTSRFEDYTDLDGEERTGCFWIGN